MMLVKESRSIGLVYGQIAQSNADFPALIREAMVLNHGEFWQLVRAMAFRMRALGVTNNSLIALNTHDMFISLGVLFASSLLGSRLVVASKVLAHAQTVQPTHFFRSFEAVGSKLVEFREIDESWFPNERTKSLPDDFPGTPDPESDWLYLHTSGTTGKPKFIALSERMVRDRTLAVSSDFPFRKTTFASVFNYTSRPFYARAIGTLLNAGSIVDSEELNFWVKSGVNLVCGAPGQVTALLNGQVISPRLPRLEVSGAKLLPGAAEAFLESFEQVVDVYGAGETNKTFANIICRDSEGHIFKTGKHLDSIVEIVSADGKLCPPGSIGSVRVKNDYTAKEYLRAPELSAKSFRDGWFYPGDLATWGENGELIVLSREDDVINLGGYKINATLLDLLFASVEGIREAIVFNNPKPSVEDRILIFVVYERDVDRGKLVAEVCRLAQAKIGVVLMPRCVRSIDAIPRTQSGEPDRLSCENLVRQRAGLFDEPEQP